MLDATCPATELSREIHDRVREMLPDPVPPVAEANTGSFPAIVDDVDDGVRSGSASRDWFAE